MSEEKVFFMSLVFVIGLNLLVAPFVDGEESGLSIPELSPPADAMISPDYQNPSGGGITGALDKIAGFLTGVINSITWLIGTMFGLLFGFFIDNLLLSTLNIIIGITATVSFVKILPTT